MGADCGILTALPAVGGDGLVGEYFMKYQSSGRYVVTDIYCGHGRRPKTPGVAARRDQDAAFFKRGAGGSRNAPSPTPRGSGARHATFTADAKHRLALSRTSGTGPW